MSDERRWIRVDVPVVDSLDAAWAEVEAELPEGRALHLHRRDRSQALASDPTDRISDVKADAYGDTPAAALRALAAKLRDLRH